MARGWSPLCYGMHKESDATKLQNVKNKHENLMEKEDFLVAVISEDMFTKENCWEPIA